MLDIKQDKLPVQEMPIVVNRQSFDIGETNGLSFDFNHPKKIPFFLHKLSKSWIYNLILWFRTNIHRNSIQDSIGFI